MNLANAAKARDEPQSKPMNITDTARRHHDELFPNHVSKLAVTDPETGRSTMCRPKAAPISAPG